MLLSLRYTLFAHVVDDVATICPLSIKVAADYWLAAVPVVTVVVVNSSASIEGER
jgi:hypothetical protein